MGLLFCSRTSLLVSQATLPIRTVSQWRLMERGTTKTVVTYIDTSVNLSELKSRKVSASITPGRSASTSRRRDRIISRAGRRSLDSSRTISTSVERRGSPLTRICCGRSETRRLASADAKTQCPTNILTSGGPPVSPSLTSPPERKTCGLSCFPLGGSRLDTAKS
jgi:hypothetical protein